MTSWSSSFPLCYTASPQEKKPLGQRTKHQHISNELESFSSSQRVTRYCETPETAMPGFVICAMEAI